MYTHSLEIHAEDDFLQMMVYDRRCNPTNSINKLYVKFLYPLFWQEVVIGEASEW